MESKLDEASVREMLGTIDHGTINSILQALVDQDAVTLIGAVSAVAEHSMDFSAVLEELLVQLHRIAMVQVDPSTEIVLVHDAVRPFVTVPQIERVIAEARTRGAAILGIPAIDTVKEVKRASLPEDVALISATIPRERIVLAQTPQAFSYALLRDAFKKAQQDGVTASDEAAVVERFGHDVFVVLGSERNLKITRPADMELAAFYLEQERRGAKK